MQFINNFLGFFDKTQWITVIIAAIGLIKYAWDQRQKKKILEAEKKPMIFIHYELSNEENGSLVAYIIIKNYGKTVGWINNISIEKPFENDILGANQIAKLENVPLPPEAKIKTLVEVEGVEKNLNQTRQFKINYSPSWNRKINYEEEYSINEKNLIKPRDFGK